MRAGADGLISTIPDRFENNPKLIISAFLPLMDTSLIATTLCFFQNLWLSERDIH